MFICPGDARQNNTSDYIYLFVVVNMSMSAGNRHFQTNYWWITTILGIYIFFKLAKRNNSAIFTAPKGTLEIAKIYIYI